MIAELELLVVEEVEQIVDVKAVAIQASLVVAK
jgi:hypothetical protein